MIPTNAQGEGAPLVALRAQALLLAALTALAGLAALGALPRALLAPCAAPVILAGAGLPILLCWLRAEPCPLKIAALAALLSPLLFGVIHLLARLVLAPDPALASTFGAILLLQPLALLRRDRLARPGRAAWIALGAGLACAALVGLLLLAGNVVRLDGALFGRCALALAIDRGVPPTNPLLAGAAWAEPWLYEFRDERDFDPGLMIELDRLGRPGIAMVCRADRRDRPWLENKFGPRGFRVLKVIGSVALFAWPAEVVASVPEAERAFPGHHFPRRDREPVYGREERR